MQIILLGGFLGSGKTTVLLQLASKLVGLADSRDRTSVVIIENEIGEVGVDDKLLKSRGLEVRELFAGCACCSSGGDLIQDIEAIREDSDPQWIVIEATGVAYPKAIKQRIEETLGLSVKVLALADAARWRRLWNAMQHMLTAQLDCADVILLNKSDLADAELLDEASDDIRWIMPNTELFLTNAREPISDEIWRKLL